MRKSVHQKRLRKFEETMGICCFIAGLVAPMVGGLLTMVEWIVESADHRWLHIASTGLFVVGIPLILFAGFCLDWAEREQKMSPHAVPTSNKRTPTDSDRLSPVMSVPPALVGGSLRRHPPANLGGTEHSRIGLLNSGS